MKLKEYLNNKYPAKKTTKEIIISRDNKEEKNVFKKIDGWDLNLSEYPNLEILMINGKCLKSSLKKLNISNCKKLIELSCPNNYLKELDLSNNHQLEKLDISNNRFSHSSLSFLNHLKNLKVVELGNRGIQSKSKNWNHFSGSLESLENLNKLEELDVSHTNIKEDLDSFLEKKWKELGFSLAEIEKWNEVGLKVHEYEFAYYLKTESFEPSNEVVFKESWKNIHESFDFSKRKNWEEQNFNYFATEEWIIAGAEIDDFEFIGWLKNSKNETPEWIATYKDDYEILSGRFKEYGLCSECKEPNTGEQWCKDCNSKRIKKNFKNWTSGNEKINKFIQKYQLVATDANKFIEWIPYEQFTDIEFLAEGGFGKVYKARWITGNISHWDNKNKQWQREKDFYYERNKKKKQNFKQDEGKYKKYKPYREVVLKSLNNSQNNIEFLDETAKHKIIDDWFNNIVPCYGISQERSTDPFNKGLDKQGDYLMVMQYIEGGNLRHYLKNKNLTFQDKLKRLTNIIQGLKDIHQKELVHRDFHSGNILNNEIHSFITDLGLCKSVGEVNKEEIYGVLPYIAPEVLRVQPYTQASDIYSFGIVTYEVFANASPYLDKEWDILLSLEICKGLRPNLEEVKIPPILKDLIERCWSDNLEKRPTATELESYLRNWQQNPKFRQQIQEIEKEYNQIYQNSTYKLHPTANMNSKLIKTKEITRLLSQSQSGQIYEQTTNEIILEDTTDLKSCAILSDQLQNVSLNNWTNIHYSFTSELQNRWENLNFTYQQTQTWINAGLQPTDYNFCAWLRDEVKISPIKFLNDGSKMEDLREQFSEYQTHIEQPPK